MFQGIIKAKGRVLQNTGFKLSIAVPREWKIKKGDSIAVNGCCLTAVEILKNQVTVDLGIETRGKTNLSQLKKGDEINIEQPLRYGEGISGHLVLGHIDAKAKVIKIKKIANSTLLEVEIAQLKTPGIVLKGSIALEGVSLTINKVRRNGTTRVETCLIPETVEKTNLGAKKQGDLVNLEFDYLSKIIKARRSPYVQTN